MACVCRQCNLIFEPPVRQCPLCKGTVETDGVPPTHYERSGYRPYHSANALPISPTNMSPLNAPPMSSVRMPPLNAPPVPPMSMLPLNAPPMPSTRISPLNAPLISPANPSDTPLPTPPPIRPVPRPTPAERLTRRWQARLRFQKLFQEFRLRIPWRFLFVSAVIVLLIIGIVEGCRLLWENRHLLFYNLLNVGVVVLIFVGIVKLFIWCIKNIFRG